MAGLEDYMTDEEFDRTFEFSKNTLETSEEDENTLETSEEDFDQNEAEDFDQNEAGTFEVLNFFPESSPLVSSVVLENESALPEPSYWLIS